MKEMEVTLLSISDFNSEFIQEKIINNRIPKDSTEFAKKVIYVKERDKDFITSSISGNYVHLEPYYKEDTTIKEISDVIIRPVLNLSEEMFNKIVFHDGNNSDKSITQMSFGHFPQRIVSKPNNFVKSEDYFTLNSFGRSPSNGKFKWKKHKVLYSGQKSFIKCSVFRLTPPEYMEFGYERFFVEILPIIWYIDYDNKRLISKQGLISNIALTQDFKGSELYYYLNNHFLKEMLQFTDMDYYLRDKKEPVNEPLDDYISDIKKAIVRINELKYDGCQTEIDKLLKLANEYLNFRLNHRDYTPLMVFAEKDHLYRDLFEIEEKIDDEADKQGFLRPEFDVISKLEDQYSKGKNQTI